MDPSRFTGRLPADAAAHMLSAPLVRQLPPLAKKPWLLLP